MATYAIARGLSLQSRTTYFATVKAVDFTGKSSYIVSRGVSIDSTDPVVDGVMLTGITHFQSRLRLEWNQIIDDESGIGGVEWGLGTRPGSSDIAGWNQVSLDLNTGVQLNTTTLNLYEGEIVFASLKVCAHGAMQSTVRACLFVLGVEWSWSCECGLVPCISFGLQSP